MWLKDKLKSAVAPGIRHALRELQREIRLHRIHRRESVRARRAFADGGSYRIHMGCGCRLLTGWINVDLIHPSANYHLDLRRPFPWPDASVERIYSEHFVEHLAHPGELQFFLSECLRVLRPGGLFEAGMPDVERNLLAYANRDAQFFQEQRRKWGPSWAVTPLDSINFTFRQGGEHKYAYDYETLAQRLTEAGFSKIRRRPWNPELDSPGWENSLYIEAHRPE